MTANSTLQEHDELAFARSNALKDDSATNGMASSTGSLQNPSPDDAVAKPEDGPNFSNDIYYPFRSEMLTPEQVREFSRLRPTRVVLDTARHWLWIAAAWTVAFYYPNPLVVAATALFVGAQYYGLFIIGHDGMHRRLFRKRETNDLFCDLFLLGPIATITRINNRNHMAHHRYLASHSDPDRHKYGCLNKHTRPLYLVFITGLASVPKVLVNVFAKKRASSKAVTTSASTAAQSHAADAYTLRDAAIILGWQIALVGGLTTAFGWWGYPVMWLGPVYFTYLFDLLRSFLEHAQPRPDDDSDEHRLITYSSNWLERMFFAPENMNFHTVHHLWTSIPYYNLPAANRIIRKHPLAERLEWRTSYLGFLLKYATKLPILGCVRKDSY